MSRALLAAVIVCSLTTGCGRLGFKLVDPPVGTSDVPNSPLQRGDAGPAPADDGDGVNDELDACPLDPERSTTDVCGCNPELPPERSAHWMLDETAGTTAFEATGTAPDGSLTNFAGAPWVTGAVDGALSFDGVDDFVQIGTLGASVKSITFWIKPGSPTFITNQTGTMFPSSLGPKSDWSSPENAFAADGKNASASSLIGNKEQHWGGFHLAQALPPGVSIRGITVSIKTSNFGVLGSFGVELSWDGGTSHTSADYSWGQLVAGSDERQAGGPDQLWGRAWTTAELSDANFRVRGSFGGLVSSMSLDYVKVQVHYSDHANPRNILNLNGAAQVEFTGTDLTMAVRNWPGASTYVNGAPGATLTTDWNHVVITGDVLSVSQLQFGNVSSEVAAFPFQGLLDDVALFEDGLSQAQITTLHQFPNCGL